MANLIDGKVSDGQQSMESLGGDEEIPRSFLSLAEPPMPLIPESKFSLEPDLALGWKPDQLSLNSIPSLQLFKPLHERQEEQEKK